MNCNTCRVDAGKFIYCPLHSGDPDIVAAEMNKIAGLKEARRIAESRFRSAIACKYNESYQAGIKDILVFLLAEIERREHPETASHTTLDG